MIKWKKILSSESFLPCGNCFRFSFYPPLFPDLCWHSQNHSGWAQDSDMGKRGTSAVLWRPCKTEINLASFRYPWCLQRSQDFCIFPGVSIFWAAMTQFPVLAGLSQFPFLCTWCNSVCFSPSWPGCTIQSLFLNSYLIHRRKGERKKEGRRGWLSTAKHIFESCCTRILCKDPWRSGAIC